MLTVNSSPKMLKTSELCFLIVLVGAQLTCAVAKMTCRITKACGKSTLFEGDMILTSQQLRMIEAAAKTGKRNGVRKLSARWPNKEVVYELSDDVNAEQFKKLEAAMQVIEDHSCIKFRPRQGSEHAVKVLKRKRGCSSTVGFNNGFNTLNLADYCYDRHKTLLHELLHTLGFHHMQTTYDRNKYVKIHEENIAKGCGREFRQYAESTVTDFGVPYDYCSVMHYSQCAKSGNGKPTITLLKENNCGFPVGQAKNLSESDIIKLNKMYDCPSIYYD